MPDLSELFCIRTHSSQRKVASIGAIVLLVDCRTARMHVLPFGNRFESTLQYTSKLFSAGISICYCQEHEE